MVKIHDKNNKKSEAMKNKTRGIEGFTGFRDIPGQMVEIRDKNNEL